MKWTNVNRLATKTGLCQCPVKATGGLGVCRKRITCRVTRGQHEQFVCDYHRDILIGNGWDDGGEWEDN